MSGILHIVQNLRLEHSQPFWCWVYLHLQVERGNRATHFVGLSIKSRIGSIPNYSIIPNYNQQDATFLDLFISTDALHVSAGSSAHHQEHINVHTASGIVNQHCCLLLSWMRWKSVPSHGGDGTEFHLIHDSSKQQYWLTIPEAVCTVMCSWWWAEEPPEICRASVETNKSRNVASCWL